MSDTPQGKGGKARAEMLSPERRSEIAREAARKRWTPVNAMPGDPDSGLFAKHAGLLNLGGADLDVYVLSNGERVISLSKVVHAITGRDGGNLGEYIGVSALDGYIDKEEVLENSVDFSIPGTNFKGRGISAELFLEICRGYVSALQDNALKSERQREIAIKASILLASCAKLGIIALIDEVTGYQYEREEDALQVKLRAFISEELRAWEKTFPDDLWEEFGRLTGWSEPLKSRPKYWGKLVIELIYDTLDPDVAEYLKNNKPPAGARWHQQLTDDIGVRKLVSRCYEVIGMAKDCQDIRELKEKVARHYGRTPVQLTFYLPKRIEDG